MCIGKYIHFGEFVGRTSRTLEIRNMASLKLNFFNRILMIVLIRDKVLTYIYNCIGKKETGIAWEQIIK